MKHEQEPSIQPEQAEISHVESAICQACGYVALKAVALQLPDSLLTPQKSQSVISWTNEGGELLTERGKFIVKNYRPRGKGLVIDITVESMQSSHED